MPRAYRKDVSCIRCGAEIITDGKLTCPRCHESVDIASSEACPEQGRRDVIRDIEGRWKCQKCLEHGRPSKTLAIGDEIQCRVCPEKTKNYLFEKPFDPSTRFRAGKLRVKEPEMPKTVIAKTASGPTKLTTKEYNALLQRWLKDEKKKKRELINTSSRTCNGLADTKSVVDQIKEIKKRIEALEKAIALNFDPDKLEEKLNIPLSVRIYKEGVIVFDAKLLCKKEGLVVPPRVQLVALSIWPVTSVWGKAQSVQVWSYADHQDSGSPMEQVSRIELSGITDIKCSGPAYASVEFISRYKNADLMVFVDLGRVDLRA